MTLLHHTWPVLSTRPPSRGSQHHWSPTRSTAQTHTTVFVNIRIETELKDLRGKELDVRQTRSALPLTITSDNHVSALLNAQQHKVAHQQHPLRWCGKLVSQDPEDRTGLDRTEQVIALGCWNQGGQWSS